MAARKSLSRSALAVCRAGSLAGQQFYPEMLPKTGYTLVHINGIADSCGLRGNERAGGKNGC